MDNVFGRRKVLASGTAAAFALGTKAAAARTEVTGPVNNKIPLSAAEDIPSVINRAKSNGYQVILTDSVTLIADAYIQEGGLCSSSGGHNPKIKLNVGEYILRCGFDDARKFKFADYANLRDIAITGSKASSPLMINYESHWQTLERASFRGAKDRGVPLLKLGAVLYSRIRDCDFGGPGEGDGISAIPANWPKTYYGLNSSWMSGINFNVRGAALRASGQFSLRDSTIESTETVEDKIILGDPDGKYQSTAALLDNLYFEVETDLKEPSAKSLVRIVNPSRASINNCLMFLNNQRHPDASNSSAIRSDTWVGHLSVRNNYYRGPRETKYLDVKTASAGCYVEAIGNDWSTTDQYSITIDGHDLAALSSVGQHKRNVKIYVRDRQHGELKQGIPERNIWTIVKAAEPIYPVAGKQFVVSETRSAPLKVVDRDSWKGARFTVHFELATKLTHGNDFFQLAAEVGKTAPSGAVVDFVIDRNGTVREVGNASLQWQPA
jgi:hypothetical protein